MEKNDLERNPGVQPLAVFMQAHEPSVHGLVTVSPEPITHKMVTRAFKGRRLTVNARNKILRAVEAAVGQTLKKSDLFTY